VSMLSTFGITGARPALGPETWPRRRRQPLCSSSEQVSTHYRSILIRSEYFDFDVDFDFDFFWVTRLIC
jgi:hypothetical protein